MSYAVPPSFQFRSFWMLSMYCSSSKVQPKFLDFYPEMFSKKYVDPSTAIYIIGRFEVIPKGGIWRIVAWSFVPRLSHGNQPLFPSYGHLRHRTVYNVGTSTASTCPPAPPLSVGTNFNPERPITQILKLNPQSFSRPSPWSKNQQEVQFHFFWTLSDDEGVHLHVTEGHSQ